MATVEVFALAALTLLPRALQEPAGADAPSRGNPVRLEFGPVPGSPFYVGPMAGRPVVADCNGDGNPDIVVACGTCCGSEPDPKSGHLAVLLGDGKGGFRPAEGSPIVVASSVRKVALGDVNGDGKIDAVAAQHDSYDVTILLGDGRGGFRPAPGSPVAAARGSRPHTHEIALADVNADDRLDVVTTNANDNSLSVLLGDGKGGFGPAEGSPFATGRHPYDGIAIHDMNDDGKVDLVVPLLAGNKVGVLFGDGRGGFAHAPDSRYAVGERPGYAAVGDFNGDRRPDILVTHDDVGLVDVLLAEGGGKFRFAEGSPVRLSTPVWGIAVGDLDGDGDDDVALGAMGENEPAVLLGNGKGQFERAEGLRIRTGSSPEYAVLADVDRDRRLDLVTGNYRSGDVAVFLSRASDRRGR